MEPQKTKITIEITRTLFGITRKRVVEMIIPLHAEHCLFSRAVIEKIHEKFPKWKAGSWVRSC